MPHLQTIAADYAAKGIRIVAFNYQESVEIVQGFVDTYPDILFLLDDGSIYTEYAQNNYIPLNYVIEHDLNYTVDYWKEGYYEEEVLGSINAVRSKLVATLTPQSDSYLLGDTLAYDITLQSWSLMQQQAYVVVEAVLPSGNTYSLGQAFLTWTNGEVKTIHRQHMIPMSAPTGDFRLWVRIGSPPDDLHSADYFDFSVSP